jgi:periplasmic divalent cation tolerance protein
MNMETGLVLTTFPDPAAAAKVLDGLLESRLAACVQTLPIQSAYRWKGAVNRDNETLALIKTKTALYPEVEAYLKARHPYETPEIVLLPIAAGFAGYLQWIADETQ